MARKSSLLRRTHTVKLSLNESEYQKLLNLCANSGRKPATYCRLKALEPDRIVTLPVEVRTLRSDLGRIGNNLNQLTHHLNLGNPIDSVEALSLKHELGRLKQDLIQLRQVLSQ